MIQRPYYQSSFAADPRGVFFPPKDSAESDLLTFRDRLINRWSVYRNMHMGRIGLALWYFLGRQWSTLDYEAAFEGVRGAILREADDDAGIVRPVTNEIDPAVEQEVIALVKRRWEPQVVPTSNDPKIKAAAQVAEDMLKYRHAQLSWPEKRHQHGLFFCTSGTGLVYTAWDKSYFDLKPIGAPTAVFCPSCSAKLYSPVVPVDTLRAGINGMPVQHLENARDVLPEENETDVQNAQLNYCPTCPTPTPLQPVENMDPNEAESGVDVFGRPLGVDVPRGGSTLEIDLPFEFHPRNGGARVTPDTLRRWGRRKIRDLEWLEERYPHLVDQVQPDSISDLLYGDPLLGAWEMLGRWSPSLDAGILDNHVNLDEMVELPTFRAPLGRYVVCTREKVLEDSDLLEKAEVEGPNGSETVYVPRAMMSVSRYKLRPNEIWGTTIADHEISKQNRLNGLDAQVIETRLRMGSPNLIMPADMWPTEGPSMDSAYGSGKLIFLQPSLANPQFAKPEEIGSTLMPDSVYLERDRIQADIKKGIGPQDASSGAAPGHGIGTTSGLELLVQQDEKSRSLREDELALSTERSWSHLLQLEWALRVDEDVYRVLGPNKTWKYEQYRGNVLRGQTEVTIERGAFIGRSIVRREAAREALADKLVVIDGPLARRRMLEAYGLDTDINEDTNNQVDHAERLWVEFLDKGVVRVQDQIDDAALHYQVLGIHLRTDEGERYADEAGWDEIERAIAGWEDELRSMMMMEAKSIAFYGGRLNPQQAEQAYTRATVDYQRQQDLYKQQQRTNVEMGKTASMMPPGMAPPPPLPAEPPQAPPQPFPADIPVLLQDRIFMIWSGMMQAKGLAPGQQPPQPDDLARPPKRDPLIYVKLRALVTAYKISAGLAMGMGMLGGPPSAALPAPGSGATMIPSDTGSPAGPAGPPSPSPSSPMPGGGAH